MTQQYANYLLKQAEANEVYAVLMGGRKAKKLNKAASDMRKKAIAIMDEITGYEPDERIDSMSDEELLIELGL